MTTPAAGALFDLDGTLIDTYGPHYRSWADVCLRRGVRLSEEVFAASFGRRNPEVIPLYWNSSGREAPPADQFEAIAAEKEARYRELVEHDFPVFPGAMDFVDALRAAGVRVGIGTSAPPANVAQALLFLGADRFDAVVDASQVVRGKPEPDVYLEGARRLGTAPAKTAVFEDAVVGLEAGRRAGAVLFAFDPARRGGLAARWLFDDWRSLGAALFLRCMTAADGEAAWIP